MATYIKKNEYNAPELNINDIVYQDYIILYAKDEPSKLTINNIIKNKITNNIIGKIYNPEDKI